MREMGIWTCRDQMQMECQICLVLNGFGDGDKKEWMRRIQEEREGKSLGKFK